MRKVAVMIEDYFDERELIYPYYRFLEAGFEAHLVGPRKGEFKSKVGLSFKSDFSVDEVNPEEYDAVFIPGGYAPDRLRRHRGVLSFVKGVYGKGGVVGAVCHGPWVLISAGIVKGKRVTGFFSIKDDLVNAGAQYTGKKVEVEGKLVTGTDPSALPQMMKKILELLG